MRRFVVIVAVAAGLAMMIVAGCETSGQTGALIGTAIGAGVGQAIGHNTGGTLIGAGAGAAGGYIIGNEMDKKKTEEKRTAEVSQLRSEMNTETVNVTNSNGSVIQVMLRKQGVGWVGPKGEYYDKLPTEDQLRPVYGF